MARALVADPNTKTLSVSLSGKPAGVVTMRVRQKGHPGHHHATATFGPLTGCHRLPSARVFDCGPKHECNDCAPHHTPECSGRVDVPECVTCGDHGHHDSHGGHHHENHHSHHHDHHGQSVTYTATMTGCKAVFTLDNDIHDAPAGFYLADVFDGTHKVKTMDLVVRGTGLRATPTLAPKVC